jgi:hypothetical protein
VEATVRMIRAPYGGQTNGSNEFVGEVRGMTMDVFYLSPPTAASVSVASANSNKIAWGGEVCLRSAMQVGGNPNRRCDEGRKGKPDRKRLACTSQHPYP